MDASPKLFGCPECANILFTYAAEAYYVIRSGDGHIVMIYNEDGERLW